MCLQTPQSKALPRGSRSWDGGLRATTGIVSFAQTVANLACGNLRAGLGASHSPAVGVHPGPAALTWPSLLALPWSQLRSQPPLRQVDVRPQAVWEQS